MQIETKHYVEELWTVYLDKKIPFDVPYETSISPVLERDPLLLNHDINRRIMIGFRFFDRIEATLEDGEKLFGERKNISPTYYYGQRLFYPKDERCLGMFWANYMVEKGITSVIKCDCGCFITNPKEENMTVEEYIKSVKENEGKQKKLK